MSIVSIDQYVVNASEAKLHERTYLVSAYSWEEGTSRWSSYLISDRMYVPMIAADAETWHLRAIR